MSAFSARVCIGCRSEPVCKIKDLLVSNYTLNTAMSECRYFLGNDTNTRGKTLHVVENEQKRRDIAQDVLLVSKKIHAMTEDKKSSNVGTCESCNTKAELFSCDNCGKAICENCCTHTLNGRTLCEKCYDEDEP